jgi:hypothetical protein
MKDCAINFISPIDIPEANALASAAADSASAHKVATCSTEANVLEVGPPFSSGTGITSQCFTHAYFLTAFSVWT